MTDDLWNVISEGALSADESIGLTTLLTLLIRKNGSVGTAVGFSDEKRTATNQVFNVTIVEPTALERGCIVGSVYEHPGRMIVALLNQPGGEPDVVVVPSAESEAFDKMIADFAAT